MTEQSSLLQFDRAGVWRRLFALLIDAIAITVILQLLALMPYPLSHGRLQFADMASCSSCSRHS